MDRRVNSVPVIEALKTILVSRATGGGELGDDDEYRRIRSLLIAEFPLDDLPLFLRTCRGLDEFWQFIKERPGKYKERRAYIRESFAPLLDKLEFNGQTAASTAFDSDFGTTELPPMTVDKKASLPYEQPAQPFRPPMADATRRIEIFFSYAHEDDALMNAVRQQLVIYERTGLIIKWHDRLIQPGADWKREIDNRLHQARIILLFVSPHFFDSDYAYEVEMTDALARHHKGEAVVIPIILRPCPWDAAPFAMIQALPTDGRPVTDWPNQDAACLDICRGVMRVVDRLI